MKAHGRADDCNCASDSTDTPQHMLCRTCKVTAVQALIHCALCCCGKLQPGLLQIGCNMQCWTCAKNVLPCSTRCSLMYTNILALRVLLSSSINLLYTPTPVFAGLPQRNRHGTASAVLQHMTCSAQLNFATGLLSEGKELSAVLQCCQLSHH